MDDILDDRYKGKNFSSSDCVVIILCLHPQSSVLNLFSLVSDRNCLLFSVLSIFVSPPASITMAGIKNFNPEKDIPSLAGKVIFVTGGRKKTSLTLP